MQSEMAFLANLVSIIQESEDNAMGVPTCQNRGAVYLTALKKIDGLARSRLGRIAVVKSGHGHGEHDSPAPEGGDPRAPGDVPGGG